MASATTVSTAVTTTTTVIATTIISTTNYHHHRYHCYLHHHHDNTTATITMIRTVTNNHSNCGECCSPDIVQVTGGSEVLEAQVFGGQVQHGVGPGEKVSQVAIALATS